MSSSAIKITAVVITYNRLEFLIEIINALRNQSRKLDNIIVVDNSSSDGTAEWLSDQNNVFVVRQENVGSSGGQYTGIKTAFDQGYDWIWTMDDDVVPDSDCLSNLLEKENDNLIRVPLRYTPEGKPFYNDVVRYNITNPFRKFWQEIISEHHFINKYVEVEGITFEGPLFHRSVIERIGLPEKKFFIFGDDTEYFLRVKKHNIKIEICRDAILNRKLEIPELNKINPSKKFYMVRNLIAINVIHGSLAVRVLRPIAILILWIIRVRSFADFKFTFKGFIQGYFYKSDN